MYTKNFGNTTLQYFLHSDVQSEFKMFTKFRLKSPTFIATVGLYLKRLFNKKHLKNVGPIRHNEPPHAHSPDVASGTVARRLRINVHDNDDNDNDNA